MATRRLGDGLPKFQASDIGMRRKRTRRVSRAEKQHHVICEFCGRQYVGFRDHWRCPWCGERNAPEDRRAMYMTAEEYRCHSFTEEAWALRCEQDKPTGELIR